MKIVGYLVKNWQQIYNNYSYGLLKKALTTNEKLLVKGIVDEIPKRELSRQIYGETKDLSSYSRLKGTLRDKLLDMELINVEGTGIQRKRKKVMKLQLLANSFDNMGLRPIMVDFAVRCEKEANKLKMNDVAANMCWKLAIHYKQYKHDSKKALEYSQKWEYHKSLHESELKAEWELAEAVNLCRYSQIEDVDLSQRIKAMHMGIELQDDSYRLHYYWYLLRSIEASLCGDLDAQIKVLKEGHEYFENLYFKHNNAITIFRRNLINAYNQKGDATSIALAENIIKFELQEEDKIPHERLVLKHELATAKTQLNRFAEALDIMSGLNIKQVSNQIEKEKILINTLYLQILTEDRKVNFQSVKRKCRLAKEDPGGMGLALLIAEGMSHMLHGQIYRFEDKASEIEKYIAEHLDTTKQAKHINLLRKLTGYGEVLDTSEADDFAWIGSVHQLSAVIRKREMFI